MHTRGIRLHVQVQGPADAPLVLLIHGFAGGHFDWDEIMSEFRAAADIPVRLAAVDLRGLGENTVNIDCDVLQADGGTRTASITGAYVALADALAVLKARGVVPGQPLLPPVAAVSVGIIDGAACLDLPYEEDSRAEVDMNVVMTEAGKFVEIQGTGEEAEFSRAELNTMLDLAEDGLNDLVALQKKALAAELGETVSL